jgi:hypothetical protein
MVEVIMKRELCPKWDLEAQMKGEQVSKCFPFNIPASHFSGTSEEE